jgi:hypothetical protein
MSSIEKTILAPPAIPAAPAIALPADGVATRAQAGTRSWILTALLLFLPLLAYFPTTFHDYGLRDDYSNLREAHEEPGKVLAFCASHARPLYGMLLQATYGQTTSVQNLEWMRLGAALLLGTLALVSFRSLRAFGWSFNSSLCFALLVGLVPSAQVIAGWAVGWPYAVTALLAFATFFVAEGAMAPDNRAGRTAAQWLVALGLMIACALIYQPSALFYVVPLAAAVIGKRGQAPAKTLRWLATHVGFLVLALALALGVMSALYAAGVFVRSDRVSFETHWGEKLAWFLQQVVPNALSLFVLNDDNGRDRLFYLAGAALAGAILIAGAVLEWRRHGRARGLLWTAALCGLPTLACAASLVASERYATYRTIFAMTAVLLLFLVASVRALTRDLGVNARRLIAALALTTAFLTAQHHAYALLAVPQGNEWQLIVNGAQRVTLPKHPGDAKPRIFAITSVPADRSTATIYHDEFGSLSTNSEWVPREMFKRAMHDLHPGAVNLDTRYEFAEGPLLPPGQHYDVIIDLHRLARFYSGN